MIVKLCGIVFLSLAVYALLRQYKPEYAVFSELAAGVLILLLGAGEVAGVRDFFLETMEASGVDPVYAGILLKALGTAVVIQFASAAARDSQMNALADKIEFAGKLLILGFCIPVLKGVLQLVAAFSENI